MSPFATPSVRLRPLPWQTCVKYMATAQYQECLRAAMHALTSATKFEAFLVLSVLITGRHPRLYRGCSRHPFLGRTSYVLS